MFIINPFTASGDIVYENLGGIAMTRSGAVYNSIGANFGSVGPRKKLLIVVHAQRGGNTTMSLSSATAGGKPMSLIAEASGTISGSRKAVYLLGVDAPSVTGNVSITMGQDASDIGMIVYLFKVINLRSLIPQAPENKAELGWNSSSNDTRSVTVDVPKNGMLFAAATVYHDGGSQTFTGIPNIYMIGSALRMTTGIDVISESQIGRTVSFNKSGGAGAMHGGLVAVGLR